MAKIYQVVNVKYSNVPLIPDSETNNVYVLVIPIGSADAERGFSTMKHIKSSRRRRLTNHHLKDIMRIRINTADEIEKFPATKYAQYWVRENHFRTNDPRKKQDQQATLRDEADLKKKYLPKLSFL